MGLRNLPPGKSWYHLSFSCCWGDAKHPAVVAWAQKTLAVALCTVGAFSLLFWTVIWTNKLLLNGAGPITKQLKIHHLQYCFSWSFLIYKFLYLRVKISRRFTTLDRNRISCHSVAVDDMIRFNNHSILKSKMFLFSFSNDLTCYNFDNLVTDLFMKWLQTSPQCLMATLVVWKTYTAYRVPKSNSTTRYFRFSCFQLCMSI